MRARRGVLACTSVPTGERGLWWSALLAAGATAVLSHLTAALVWRLRCRAEAGLRRRGVAGWVAGWVAQYVVSDDLGHVRRLDVAFPRLQLGVEVDGWAWHSDRERFRRDRRAHNRLDVLGWRVLHFTWEDVMFRLDEVLDEIERRRQALANSAAFAAAAGLCPPLPTVITSCRGFSSDSAGTRR